MGGRAAAAAFYPLDLVTEILRGMRDTADAEETDPCDDVSDALLQSMAHAGACHDLPADPVLAAIQQADLEQRTSSRMTTFKYHDGTTKKIDLDAYFKSTYTDEYTQETPTLYMTK